MHNIFFVMHSAYISSFWGFAPRPSPGLCLWSQLGDFRPPDPLFCPPPLANFWLRPWLWGRWKCGS